HDADSWTVLRRLDGTHEPASDRTAADPADPATRVGGSAMTETSTVDSHVSTDRRDSPPTLYDLSRPEITADPWQWYARLRALGPVVRDRATGSWLVTRHADVTAVLADKARFTVFMDHKARTGQAPAAMRRAFFYLDRIIAFVDALDHSRQRSALAGPFTRPNVQDLDHLVAGLV